MVGNTFPYTAQMWLEDIELAHSNNIDGFALNVGKEPWQVDRVADCFAAASRTAVPFRFFLSFDMSSVPSRTEEDIELLCKYLEKFGKSERMFRHSQGIFFSTFAGEQSFFGHLTLDHAWGFVKDRLSRRIQAPIHFVPSLFIDPALFPKMKSLDGAFNWNGGWPIHLNSNSSRQEIERPVLDSDNDYIRNLQGRTVMSAVSCCFFSHYGADSWNKNYIYQSDNWLFVRRWEQLVEMRDQVDIVQIISWNDYGESHYIGPIKGAQPNSQAWVDGFPHNAWLTMASHFIRAFKDGRYPPIEKDQIFAWARPHCKYAIASSDSVPRPENWDLTDDKLWVVAFAKLPATVCLHGKRDVKKMNVSAGYTKIARCLEPGDGIKIQMMRNGVVVADCSPEGFTFQNHTSVYNFNAFTACS
ncbi:glycoside hydrolase family 71 protein [Collybiopsis luxurians FD-317 M1]|nr:glycoside hydrolase family 71 protein [Collybiopsis luxurians FD-317 M1]